MSWNQKSRASYAEVSGQMVLGLRTITDGPQSGTAYFGLEKGTEAWAVIPLAPTYTEAEVRRVCRVTKHVLASCKAVAATGFAAYGQGGDEALPSSWVTPTGWSFTVRGRGESGVLAPPQAGGVF